MRRKIVIVFDDFEDGAGNVAQLLALALSKTDDVVLTPVNLHSKPRYNLSHIKISPIALNVTMKKPWTLFTKAIFPIRKFIKESNPNVVISFLDNINTICCMACLGVKLPLIVSERNDPIKGAPSSTWNLLRKMFYKRADIITVQFDAFKNFVHYENKTVSVTPNMIMNSTFKVSHGKLHCPVRLVSIGRLCPQKRFDLMIEIVASLHKKYPNITLTIYGEGADRESLLRQIESYDLETAVNLPGKTSDSHSVLSESDIFLMTSDYEGFPNVIGEAMAVGLPVVCYSCHEGIPELINCSGVSVPSGDKQSFIVSVGSLIENVDTWKAMSSMGPIIASAYNEEVIVEKWKELIDHAIVLSAEQGENRL